MPKVVSVTEALGSGGPTVARLVGDRLGFPVVDREVFLWAAQEAGVSPETIEEAERAPSFLQRMVERMGAFLEDDGVVDLSGVRPDLSVMTSDTYRELIEGLIRSIAETRDAVILGHGSHVILKDYPNVLRVFLNAPAATRVARVAEMLQMDPAEAEKYVRENDQRRRNFFEEHLKVRRNEAQNYDLCLRTEKLDFELCAELICSCVAALPSAPLPRAGEVLGYRGLRGPQPSG